MGEAVENADGERTPAQELSCYPVLAQRILTHGIVSVQDSCSAVRTFTPEEAIAGEEGGGSATGGCRVAPIAWWCNSGERRGCKRVNGGLVVSIE